ncbi:MAG: helix-turn-helix domain-containing protein [Thermaerobacter sp.]|nr:helix-turn-helix domain-containing protein [Thermaerobacter sp.]
MRFVTSGERAALELLEMFSHRLADAEERLAEMALEGGRSRLVGYLLRAAHGTQDEQGFSRLLEPVTHTEIAGRISTTREQVSAMLSDLRRRGAVQYGRGQGMRVHRDRLAQALV